MTKRKEINNSRVQTTFDSTEEMRCLFKFAEDQSFPPPHHEIHGDYWRRSLSRHDPRARPGHLESSDPFPCPWNIHSVPHYTIPTVRAIFTDSTLREQRVVETIGMVYMTELNSLNASI